MPTESLLTISAFARAVDLAPSALRYYDEAGLLPPAEVDPSTGYRYYTPELARTAHLIRRMREIGVPVKTMRAVLDGPVERAAHLLNEVAELARERSKQTSAAVDEVVAALRSADRSAAPVEVVIDGGELAAALRRVSAVAATSDQPALCGVLLDLDATGLTVVATDRYRLAWWEIPVADTLTDHRRAFVPFDAISQLAGWLMRHDSAVLRIAGGQVEVTDNDSSYPATTAPDRFPDYRLLLETFPAPVGRVVFAREHAVGILAQLDPTPIRISVGSDRLTISCAGEPEGVHLNATTSGSRFTVSVSSLFLRESLECMIGAQVSMSFSAPDRPVRIISVEQQHLGTWLMPVRVGA